MKCSLQSLGSEGWIIFATGAPSEMYDNFDDAAARFDVVRQAMHGPDRKTTTR